MKKGVLFSLIVLLLLLNLVALKTVTTSSKNAVSGGSVEILGFNAVSERFDDIFMNAVRFDGFGGAETVKERILPFSFETDQNSFTARQEIPVNTRKMDVFFDAINAFEIWLEDNDYNNFFSGLIVDVNTVKNSFWSGNTEYAEYHILPQCLKYKVFDQNNAGFEKAGNCSNNDFSIDSVQRYDVNVLLNENADFNSVICNFDAVTGCPLNDFNSVNQNPFVEINILDENCANCSINPALKTIRTHYNPLAQNTVAIGCNGVSCSNEDLQIAITEVTVVSFEGTRQAVDIGVTFRSQIEEFSFLDFNFSVENNALRLKKSLK